MPITVHFTHADGATASHTLPTGRNLMQAATAAGIEAIAADCGGCLSCATCHVFIAEPWAGLLPPPGSDEAAMLEMTAEPRSACSRLACQVVLTAEMDGLQVGLPATQY